MCYAAKGARRDCAKESGADGLLPGERIHPIEGTERLESRGEVPQNARASTIR
jgi:hypothetical protein